MQCPENVLLKCTPIVAILNDKWQTNFDRSYASSAESAVLGRAMTSDRDLREAIRDGFPHAVLEELMRASGLTLKELADALDLSPRSLQRRRRGRLARFESDRLYRLARLLALARENLGDAARAIPWFKRTNRALGGLAPIAAIDTELGAPPGGNLLGRIAYGGIS